MSLAFNQIMKFAGFGLCVPPQIPLKVLDGFQTIQLYAALEEKVDTFDPSTESYLCFPFSPSTISFFLPFSK